MRRYLLLKITIPLMVLGSLMAVPRPAHAWRGPNAGKFNAYDLTQNSPADKRATEVRGTYMGGEIIAVDPGYRHLLLGANNRHPEEGEKGCNGNDVYADYKRSSLSANFQPVIKVEWDYGVGGGAVAAPWPATPGGDPVVLLPDGTTRPPRYGDHISATGLYVTDTGHTWYTDCPTDKYCYYRGTYYACHAHAELHPLKSNRFILIPPTPGSIATTNAPAKPGAVVSESHTVAAPIYDQFYPNTSMMNKAPGGPGGNLVEDSIIRDVNADFIIYPSPLPANNCGGGCVLAVVPDNGGSHGNVGYTTHVNSDNSVSVHMEAHGSDIYHPSVERVVFNLVWAAGSPSPPPPAPTCGPSTPGYSCPGPESVGCGISMAVVDTCGQACGSVTGTRCLSGKICRDDCDSPVCLLRGAKCPKDRR